MADCHLALDLVEIGTLSFQLNHTICNSTAKISIILASHGNGSLFCVSLVGAFKFKQSIKAFYFIFGHVTNHQSGLAPKKRNCVCKAIPHCQTWISNPLDLFCSLYFSTAVASNALPCFIDGALSRAALSNKDSNSEAEVLVERATLPKFDELLFSISRFSQRRLAKR